MTRLVGSAMARATTALLDADLAARRERDRRRRADRRASSASWTSLALDLLARQQPVATDLRTIVTGMRMSADLERMGDLARHVAKVARLRYPESAVPHDAARDDPRDGAGRRADRRQGRHGHRHPRRRRCAVQLEHDDDEMDRLHRQLFRQLLGDDWPYGIEAAIDVTLLGRYYERFADHAVSRRPPGRLPGHRRVAGTTLRRRRTAPRPSAPVRSSCSAALVRDGLDRRAAAASGSRYSPPGSIGRRSASRS